MATTEVFRNADSVTLPVASGVKSGEVVKVGGLIGVALTDRDADGNATVRLTGAFRVPVAAANYAVGDAIYGHASGGGAISARVELIDKTSTTGTLLGYALEAKNLSDPGELVIKLTQV